MIRRNFARFRRPGQDLVKDSTRGTIVVKKLGVAILAFTLPTGIASAAPYLPTYGSPNSIQSQAERDNLDMLDVQPEGDDRMGPEGDSDTIGGAFTYWGVTGQNGNRIDLHYQHARRIFEGSRARLLIDAPFNILHAGPDKLSGETSGATAVMGTINVGIELPVKSNWIVTPRVSYGFAAAGAYFGGDGELLTASLNSRYQIRQVGRGELILGNSIAYTHTTKLFTQQNFYAPTINWVFRNGLAYQLPLKHRMFGRQSSLRFSYVFMNATKDPLSYSQQHEVGVSIGVRSREAEQKNRFEQMRIGLLYTHSKNEFASNFDYDSVTLTLGYRF